MGNIYVPLDLLLMTSRGFFVWILFSQLFLALSIAISNHPLLLIVSLDGLGYNFISENLTPNIWKVAKNGVYAPEGIQCQVMTLTSPNHHCIATGLYEESHGIIENTFYDPVFEDYFDNWNFSKNSTRAERSLKAFWYKDGGEPVWRTNMKISGRLSGSLFWPLGNAEYLDSYPRKHKSKGWKEYGNFSVWASEIDQLIDWFTDESDPINLGLYYIAQPDHTEHANDLNSDEVKRVIKEVDSAMGYLVERLKSVGIYDRINLILTADHGHASVPDQDHIFDLSRYIDFERVIRSGPSYFPPPRTNVTVEEIYQNLSRAVHDGLHFKLYRKEDVPERYHYKHNRRIGPVLTFYDLHYWDSGHYGAMTKNQPVPRGTHGYLNEHLEMKPFFVARGPAFKRGFRVSGDFIENVDLYPLMCHLLSVDPAPNNGSLERISVILKDQWWHVAVTSSFFGAPPTPPGSVSDDNQNYLIEGWR